MILTVFVICLLLGYSLSACLIIAVVSALLESVTPLGLDNLTVPILTALLGELLC